jgi:hypothetical protein
VFLKSFPTTSIFVGWLSSPAGWRWAAGSFLGLLILFVYSPVLRFDYLYHDDWVFFAARANLAGSSMAHWIRIEGRPLEQYVLRGLFGLFDTVETAWLARLAVVGGIVAFAILQSIYFQTLGISWSTAVSLAFGTSVLPGMLVFSYWITAGAIIFSLLLSVVAALLTAYSLQSGKGVARRIAFLVSACLLQTASLLIYQTGAMYFWTLAAVMLATTASTGLTRAVRPLAVYAVVGGCPMLGFFIWFRYLSGLAPLLAATDPRRGRMFPDLAHTAKWFFITALPNASSLWFFDFPRGFGVALLCVWVASLVLFSAPKSLLARRRGDRTEGLLYMAYPLILMALCLGAFLPMLVTGFHLDVFRSLIPLSSLVFLTGTIHLGMILQKGKWPPVFKTCLVSGFVIGLSCLAAQSLTVRMILPAVTEYSFVRDKVREAAHRGWMPDVVHAVAPRHRPKFETDEIDNLAILDVGPMIQALSPNLGWHVRTVIFHLEGEWFDRTGAFVVDFGELAKMGLWKFAPSRTALLLWTYGGSYDLVLYQNRIYAVPRSSGRVDWESGTVPTIPGMVSGSTVADVITHLPPDATDSAANQQPRLLRSYQRYNLVAFGGRVYAVPQALGRLELEDWTSGRVGKLPGVIVEKTVEEVLERLPK